MNDCKISRLWDNIKRNWEHPNRMENIETSEKIVSMGTGVFIFFKGIGHLIGHPLMGMVEVAIGSGLLYRGLTGYCPVKDMTECRPDDAFIVTETIITENSPLG